MVVLARGRARRQADEDPLLSPDRSTGKEYGPGELDRLQEAVRACKERGYGGIGFVFTPEDDLCGVDLDGCLDPETGEIEPWAWEIIEELDSYTEISPSGTGVHILVRGELPEGRNRKGRFETYDRGRYFTVTGKHLAGTPQSHREAARRSYRASSAACSEKKAPTATRSP